MSISLDDLLETTQSTDDIIEECIKSPYEGLSKEPTVIDTALFRIEFKEATLGDNVVDLSESVIGQDIFSLAERMLLHIARLITESQATLFGDEAVANRTAPRLRTAFDAYGLKTEFKDQIGVEKAAKIELDFATILSLHTVVQQLIAERQRVFPRAVTPLQLAWDSSRQKASERVITDLNEALEFRLETAPALTRARNRLAVGKQGREIAPLSFATAGDILDI